MIHSLMFIPAKTKMLEKAASFDADGCIFDLEDSIPPAERDAARDLLVAFLSNSCILKPCFVRVNEQCTLHQVVALASLKMVSGIMIPKIDMSPMSTGMVRSINEIGKKIIALIETPRSIEELGSIAAMKGVWALALGAEDLTCALGAENCDDVLAYFRSRLVTCAKVHGLLSFDTPTFETKDVDKIYRNVDVSRKFGFDGKLVIHPAQLPVVKKCFSNSDPLAMQRVIESYEHLGGGVQVIDGRVYEAMHIKRMKKILSESDRKENV